MFSQSGITYLRQCPCEYLQVPEQEYLCVVAVLTLAAISKKTCKVTFELGFLLTPYLLKRHHSSSPNLAKYFFEPNGYLVPICSNILIKVIGGFLVIRTFPHRAIAASRPDKKWNV